MSLPNNLPLEAMDLYFYEINQVPPLAPDEEAQLLQQFATSNDTDRKRIEERLIAAYQTLVVSIARPYARRCNFQSLLDLVQEGNLGLLQALRHFDDAKEHTTFCGWATTWVRGAILNAVSGKERAIHLPRHKVRMLQQLRLATRHLQETLEHEPTLEEIATKMALPLEDIYELTLLLQQQTCSLFAPVGNDEELTLADVLPDADSTALVPHNRRSLEESITRLDEKERLVIRLMYGFEDGHSYTIIDIAQLLGISESEVTALSKQALKIFRKSLTPC